MKKVFLLLAVLFYLSGSVFAGTKGLFHIDREKINAELSDLYELESYVKATDMTLSGLTSVNSPLIANVSSNSMTMSMLNAGEPPLGINSFLWGFCFGLPGLAVVYFVTEDTDETRRALWGCVAGTVLWTGIYVIYWAAVINSTAIYY